MTSVAGEPARRAQRLRRVAQQREIVEKLREKVWTLRLGVGLLSFLVVSLMLVGLK